MRKKSLLDFYKMKEKGEKVAWITAYDAPTGAFAEAVGMDMLLVGDSLGMCVLGLPGTVPVTMEECLHHTRAVRNGAPNTYVIGDMPFLSYQTSTADAVLNAGRFLKEADADAIKLEGGVRIAKQIRAIADAGMVVFGHIGLTPQSSGQLGGFKAQGLTVESAKLMLQDAIAVEEAGAHFLLVEAVAPEVTKVIHQRLSIPVYSIGAGVHCDGQLLIVSDLLGIFEAFTPKFVKKYANLAEEIERAFAAYRDEVKSGVFPGPEHVYNMLKGEVEEFEKIKDQL
ncbi:MAG: 3-methyl-2-oxobutanoate hydroxymethyltransferase [Candidatus Omnitrophica bacterium]|nr:3-methyl-2-oxobutanoate hydroxymethyltransferase [Candidatus Omnitrophota bacterium]